MKVLITCLPAMGHFHPMGPLGRALAEAGHEVAFASSAPFVPTMERAGFAAVAVGMDWLESDAERAFPDLVTDPADLELYTTRHVWPRVFAAAAPSMLRDLVELLGTMRPDVVVSAGIEFGGPLAAEANGIPHVRLGIDPYRPPATLMGGLGTYLARTRADLGLDPDPTLERLCPYLYVDAYPPSLQRLPPEELPPVRHAVRPDPYVGEEGECPDWLRERGDRPLVHVTMGTIFNRVSGTFETVLSALQDEPVDVVVTIGANRDPAELGPQPANVRIERFVPLTWILRRADVVVCHAPYNTTVGALSHGLPMLCMPFAGDQLYNAFRIAACGAGLRLDWRGIGRDQVRDAIRALLREPVYRANARRLRDEMNDLPPVATAVSLVERVAAREPLHTGGRNHR